MGQSIVLMGIGTTSRCKNGKIPVFEQGGRRREGPPYWPDMEIELRHFRAFLAVVENGSLGEAAKRLGVSQPTLTHIIQALERELGGVLFNRSSQGMELNGLGRAIEARARVIVGEVGRAEREIGELLDAQRGRIVIGGGPVFAHPAIRRGVGRFREAHPKVEIELHYVFNRKVIPEIKAGEIDYAI